MVLVERNNKKKQQQQTNKKLKVNRFDISNKNIVNFKYW